MPKGFNNRTGKPIITLICDAVKSHLMINKKKNTTQGPRTNFFLGLPTASHSEQTKPVGKSP